MSGDWIKMEAGLHEKNEVIAISARTGLDQFQVVGRLHRLWGWADRNTTTGELPGVPAVWVDQYLQADGFAQALESQGWLKTTDAGIFIPNFNRHNGNSAKRRAEDSRRRREIREEKRREEDIRSGEDKLPTNCGQTADKVEIMTPAKEVVEYYRKLHPGRGRYAKEIELINKHLAAGFTVEDLKDAIDGCHLTPHNLGENTNGTTYLELELIVRNEVKLKSFIRKKREPRPVKTGAGAGMDYLFSDQFKGGEGAFK